MPLTRDFRTTVKERADKDPDFRAALLQEAIQSIADGDLPTARALIRDVINATCGFKALSAKLGVGEKSLMRMYGPKGNPRADNLLATLAHLQSAAKLIFRVLPVRKEFTVPDRAPAPRSRSTNKVGVPLTAKARVPATALRNAGDRGFSVAAAKAPRGSVRPSRSNPKRRGSSAR